MLCDIQHWKKSTYILNYLCLFPNIHFFSSSQFHRIYLKFIYLIHSIFFLKSNSKHLQHLQNHGWLWMRMSLCYVKYLFTLLHEYLIILTSHRWKTRKTRRTKRSRISTWTTKWREEWTTSRNRGRESKKSRTRTTNTRGSATWTKNWRL